MATHPATPYQTTLSAAMTADGNIVKSAASTGFAAGSYLVVGREVMLITTADTTNHTHAVKRGMKGTKAKTHPSGAIVTLGTATTFGNVTDDGIQIAGYVGDLGTPTLPIGSRYVDPETGYEYILCDSAAAYVVGEWVVITAAGAASQMSTTCKGRVGIVVDAVSASDKLFWAMVVGSFASALCASLVTTAGLLAANAGYASLGTTCDGGDMIIHGATCTTIPASAVCPISGAELATVYVCNPWVSGTDDITS